jgi:hypothetical protein
MQPPIIARRLHNQRLSRPGPRDPARLVAWLGVVQAQEFGPAKWGLGLRMPPGTGDAAIQRAFDAGKILRTHVLRSTWHFVAPNDIRWMLELSAPHERRRMAAYDRQMGLDTRVLTRATAVIERALTDHRFLTRAELGEHLARARLPATGSSLAHIALYAELEGVMCSGPRRGKQTTYALLERRAPRARRLPRDQAIAELARRFLQSHGPATHRDLAWWSGLPTGDAKRGIEMTGARQVDAGGLTCWTLGTGDGARVPRDAVHLLPIYDEYLNAYRDRRAESHGPSLVASKKGGYGTFQHALLIAGRVAGTWRVTPGRGGVELITTLVRPLRPAEERNLRAAVARYRKFLAAG